MRTRQTERRASLLRDPDYRRAYVESFVDSMIASQIKANRERRGWLQEQLGERAQKAGGKPMAQSRISALEDINYSAWSVRTLRRLAAAFDLALIVKFVRFSEALSEIDNLDESDLYQPPFDEDARAGEREGLAFTDELVASERAPQKHPSLEQWIKGMPFGMGPPPTASTRGDRQMPTTPTTGRELGG